MQDRYLNSGFKGMFLLEHKKKIDDGLVTSRWDLESGFNLSMVLVPWTEPGTKEGLATWPFCSIVQGLPGGGVLRVFLGGT